MITTPEWIQTIRNATLALKGYKARSDSCDMNERIVWGTIYKRIALIHTLSVWQNNG